MIGFSDTAFTYLEPADLRFLQGMPVLAAQSLTSFAAAFDQLTYRISVDIPSLKAQGYTVHRPAVFFLTDGLPNGNEDLCSARARLLAEAPPPTFWLLASGMPMQRRWPSWPPNHISFPSPARGVDTGAAISEFLTSLTQSVISSDKPSPPAPQSCNSKNPKASPSP